MARWLVNESSRGLGLGPTSQSWLALLPTLIFFYICVSMLLALCTARNPEVLDLNHRGSKWPAGGHPDMSSRDPEGELAPEQATESKKLSHRFSSTSAITKLSASFRILSFRDPPSSSFRISSFRTDCRSQVDVMDALRRSTRPAVEEVSTEPAVWQRAILRGERCVPLSFSGLILYDEHGNPLPSTTTTKDQQDLLNHQQSMDPFSSR